MFGTLDAKSSSEFVRLSTDICGVYLLYFVISINLLEIFSTYEFCFLSIRNLE